MIYAEPTKKGVGVSLYGDALDLGSLHETVHELVRVSHFNEEQGNTILNFAYEIRHAKQGDREIVRKEVGPEEYVTYYKFNLPWTSILFELHYLREIVGYGNAAKEHQANIYRLEYAIESALLSYDAKVGREVIDAYRRLSWFSDDYLADFIDECTYQYINGGATGKMRFRRLPSIIKSYDERSFDYKAYHEHMWKEAKKHNVHPAQLFDTSEWPDVEW